MDDDVTHSIGAHSCWFEPPDLFRVRLVGDISPSDFEGINQVALERSARAGHLFWLVDVTRAGSIEPEARRLMVQEAPPPWVWGAAVFGLGFPQRVLLRMMQRAAALLGVPGPLVEVCAGEAEALAWIAAERQRRTARRAAG